MNSYRFNKTLQKNRYKPCSLIYTVHSTPFIKKIIKIKINYYSLIKNI
nr:MAG TPA: hypothetical protein [Caudoviricetes sp.]